MPLDPSIGLNVNAPKPVDLASAYGQGLKLRTLALEPERIQQELAASRQQVSASQTAQANAAAQLPSIQAKAAQDERLRAGDEYIRDNTPNYTLKNSDGTEQLDANKKPIVDMQGLMQAALSAGHHEAAIVSMGNYSDVLAKNIKNASDFTTASKEIAGVIAPILEATPKDKRPQLAAVLAEKWNQRYPKLGDSVVGNYGNDFGDESIQSIKNVAMGATAAAQNLISRGQLALSGESVAQAGAGGTGPESRSKTSSQTVDAYKRLAEAGMTATPGQSYAQLIGNPQYRAILEATVISAPSKEKHTQDVNKIVGLQSAANSAIASGQTLSNSLRYAGVPSDKFGNLLSKWGSNPDYQNLENALQKYENETGTKVDRSTLSVSGVVNLITQWKTGQGGLDDFVASHSSQLKSPTYSGVKVPESVTPGKTSAEGRPLIRTKEEYDLLKSGTKYMSADGTPHTKK